MSPDKEARAAALRVQLEKESPTMLAFMEQMKREFGAVVLHVKTPSIEVGKPLEPGITPHVPLPADTWPYKVGESAAGYYSGAKKARRR